MPLGPETSTLDEIAPLAGALFGASVPTSWQLGFVVPLAFIALMMRFLSDDAAKVAALASGVPAVVGAGFPLGTGLIVATVGGTAAGLAMRR